MPKELYLLVDGTHADPDECDVGADHELRHANGLAVALNEDGSPQTVSQGAIDNKNVEAAQVGESDAPPPAAELKDEPEGDAVQTEINPAKPADDDLLLTTGDLKPEAKKAAPKPKKATARKPEKPKNRELRTR